MAPITPVGTFAPTNYTTMSGTAYPLQIDADLAVAARMIGPFAPHPATTPAMSVVVDAGHIYTPASQSLSELAAQTVSIAAAPASNSRIDRVVINRLTGAASVVTGTVATTPAPPAIPAGSCPVAQVRVAAGVAAIVSAMISDERDLTGLGLATVAGSGNYADLSGTPAIGTAAGNLVKLDTSARLPAVDGSQLINLPGTPINAVRQTVLDGDTVSGIAGFLTSSSLTISYTATKPLIISFANGFGTYGPVDAIAVLSTGASALILPASAGQVYLFATYDSSTTVSWSYSTYAPAYQYTAPGSPGTGQYWFDLSTWKMKVWSGSVWNSALAVCVGECSAGSSSISALIAYAFQGRYTPNWTATLPSVASSMMVSDNLGTTLKEAVFEIMCTTADTNYSVGDVVIPSATRSGYIGLCTVRRGRNVTYAYNGDTSTGFSVTNPTSNGNFAPTVANWSYRIRTWRAF